MIVVTGGAGFIGANMIKALNRRGREDILVVDNLEEAAKHQNLADCRFMDAMDQHTFLDTACGGRFRGRLEVVFHLGACTDTLIDDEETLRENNYLYSKRLLQCCQRQKTAFLYASSAAVYGANEICRESRRCESPHNAYGRYKLLFDQHVRAVSRKSRAQIIGLRYFNVYGEGERHKGRMASMAYQFFRQYRDHGRVRLFRGSGGYGGGEQRRDFISVDDVVSVNLFFFDHGAKSGIYNVGTGKSRSFNDVAVMVINKCRQSQGKAGLSIEQMRKQGIAEYIPFPRALKDKYQSYTQADTSGLRQAGYRADFVSLEEGLRRYVARLLEEGGKSWTYSGARRSTQCVAALSAEEVT